MKKLLLIFALFAGMHAHAQQVWAPTPSIGTSSNPSGVGIGTQTPLAGLGAHILGGLGRPLAPGLFIQRSDNPATNQDGGLKILFSSNSFTGVGIAGGSGAFQLVPTPNSVAPDMAFSCNNVLPQLIIKNNGNVGIGTSAPTQLLDVKGKTRTTQVMITSGAAVGSVLSCSNPNGLATWVSPSSLLTETDPKVGTLTANKIPKWGSTSLVDSKIIEVPSGPQMTVGVGTTTPHTTHGVTMSGGINNSTPQGLYIERNDINPATNQNCALSIAFSSNLFSSVGVGGGSCGFRLFPSVNTPSPDMAFSCNTVAPQMIIKFNGNVGIGTAAPNDKMEINSGVAAHSGLRFTQLNSNTSTTSTPGDFMCNKVLSLDANGEVILIDLNTCSSSSKPAGDDSKLASQQAQIDDLKNQIAELKAMIVGNVNGSSKANSSEKISVPVKKYLEQIAPNPFSQDATVSYSLPADVVSAQLVITDLSGKTLQTYSLMAGSTQQVIHGFQSGSYNCSMIVNGKLLDSKQMVVVK